MGSPCISVTTPRLALQYSNTVTHLYKVALTSEYYVGETRWASPLSGLHVCVITGIR